jgi:hypothetical protein
MINNDTQTDGSASSEEEDDDDCDKGHHTQIIQELMTGSATNVDDDIDNTDKTIIDTEEQLLHGQDQRSPGVIKMNKGGEDEGLPLSTIYSWIDCELERNPCFERVWMIRHRLNSNSLLWDAHAHALRLSLQRPQRFPAQTEFVQAAATKGTHDVSRHSCYTIEWHRPHYRQYRLHQQILHLP